MEIDVDVYKGPLANEEEIQARQFAALALAAEPVLASLRNDIEKQYRANTGESPIMTSSNHYIASDGDLKSELGRFVNGVMGLYVDCVPRDCVGRSTSGILTLTTNLSSELEKSGTIEDPASALALRKLKEMLIVFAERLLFFSNNLTDSELQRQLVTSSDDRISTLRPRMAVLQTLGNTLLLHANDLQRQTRRTNELNDGKASELAAVRSTFSMPPGAAFELMLQAIRDAQKDNPKQQSKAAAAAGTTTAAVASANDDVAAAEQAVAQASKTIDDATAEAAAPAAAVRTLIEPAQRGKNFPSASKVDANRESEDAKALKFYVAQQVTDGRKLGSDDVVALVDNWLGAKVGGPGADSSRGKRLASARDYLASQKEMLARELAQPLPVDKAYAALQDAILDSARDAQQAVDEATAKKREVDKALTATKLRHQRLTKAQENDTLVSKASAANRQRSIDIFPIVRDAREEVLRQADVGNATDAASMLVLLRSTLDSQRRRLMAVKADDPQAKRLGDALDYLATVNLSASFPVAGESKVKNRIDVLDELITLLRQQRIQAIAMGDTPRASQLLKAINAAYEARSGAIYLRPASDYLKNVYSATSLQEANPPTERNMLVDYMRNFQLWDKQSTTVEARRNLEKLFWQNINRVSLSGGGRTNYVLAKDDVGNWYVKAYASDPEAVIRSAESLALFNFGGRINTNLLRRADLQRRADDTSLSRTERGAARDELAKSGSDDNGMLQKVRDRYTSQFASTTDQLARKLNIDLATLDASLRDLVMGKSTLSDGVDGTKLLGELSALKANDIDAARRNLTAALALADTDTERNMKIADALAMALGAMQTFRRNAVFRLRDEKSGIASSDAQRGLVADAIKVEMKTRIEAVATPYKEAIATYEKALVNIGDISTG